MVTVCRSGGVRQKKNPAAMAGLPYISWPPGPAPPGPSCWPPGWRNSSRSWERLPSALPYPPVPSSHPGSVRRTLQNTRCILTWHGRQGLLWSSFFVTLVAKKIVLINLCCRPCFIWGSITIITVWTNMIIINVCKFFYLLIECFLCCKLIQICAFILQGIEVTLHRCIVVRISCFAHALCHIYRFAEFGKCFGRIL